MTSSVKVHKPFLRLVALGFFIYLPILAFLLGRMYQMRLEKSYEMKLTYVAPPAYDSSTAQTKPEGLTKEGEWKNYTNHNLGFSFSYPSEWGEVKESITVDTPGVTGKTYSLSFTSLTKYLQGSGQSADYSPGRGGTDDSFKGFSGPASVKAEIFLGYPGCTNQIQGSANIGFIDFNLPGKEISGVRLRMPILSGEDKNKFDQAYNKNTKYCTESELIQSQERALVYLSQLQNENKLDSQSLSNLTIYNTISKSAKIIIKPSLNPKDNNQFCGGIAAIECPAGYTCKLDGNYPDAGGKCVKN